MVYKRSSGKKKPTYYIGFLDEDTRTYPRRVAAAALKYQLGEDARSIPSTTKAGAEALARMALDKGVALSSPQTATKIGDYLLNFWTQDGDYALKMSRSKRPLSRAYLSAAKSGVNKHVVPWLKKTGYHDYPAHRITTAILEDMLTDFFESGITASRCNSIRTALSKPFDELRRREEIKQNPITNVMKFREDIAKRKILTIGEAKAFFEAPSDDKQSKLACLLSMATGLRISEVCGLKISDVHSEDIDDDRYWWISVEHAYTEADGLHAPKAGSRGDVPVPASVAEQLIQLHRENPWGNGYVFHGISETRPMSARDIRTEYRRVLVSVGITEEQQAARGLDFHAWRHFYASHVKDSATKVLRHADEQTTQRYTHLTQAERIKIGDQASQLLKGAGL